MALNIILVCAYFLVVLAIGWWSGKKETTDDFLIASRNVGVIRSATSMFAVLGGVALVGQAALAFTLGIGAMWFWFGLALGTIFLGFAASKIKPYADENKFLGINEYFTLHWGKRNGILSAIIIFIAFFSLLTAQFIVVGSLLGPLLGLSYNLVVVITGLVVLGYLLLGGYKAVIVTDLVQALLMMAVLLLILFTIPYGNFLEGRLNLLSLGWGTILSFVVLGVVTIMASADLWQRIFSARTVQTAKKSSYLAAALFIIFGFVITMVGIAARNGFPDASPDDALFLGIFKLVPEGLVGISVVLILAAVMSTIDTESFLLSSIITKHLVANDSSKVEEVRKILRKTLLSVAIFAVLIAIFVSNLLLILFGLISLLIIISPALVGSLFWRLKSNAVLASLIGGLVTLVVLFATNTFSPENAVATFPVALLLLILGQVFFKKDIDHTTTN